MSPRLTYKPPTIISEIHQVYREDYYFYKLARARDEQKIRKHVRFLNSSLRSALPLKYQDLWHPSRQEWKPLVSVWLQDNYTHRDLLRMTENRRSLKIAAISCIDTEYQYNTALPDTGVNWRRATAIFRHQRKTRTYVHTYLLGWDTVLHGRTYPYLSGN